MKQSADELDRLADTAAQVAATMSTSEGRVVMQRMAAEYRAAAARARLQLRETEQEEEGGPEPPEQ